MEGDSVKDEQFESSNEFPTMQSKEQTKGPSICSGCGNYIFDQYYLLIADKTWHSDCLKCYICAAPLQGISCFVKDGNVICKEHYLRECQPRVCTGCGSWIRPEEFVMRPRDFVYHTDCFHCAACKRVLRLGERFNINCGNGLLHCLNCWNSAEYFESPNGMNHAFGGFYEEESTGKSRRKKKNNIPTDPTTGMSYGVDFSDGDQNRVFQRQKTKRMRTSFKHDQLRAMKDYFDTNHNPDAKDLKQLALRTGLTKRVLQVWFQNARAKFRRGKIKITEKKDDSCPKESFENAGDSASTLDDTKSQGDASHTEIDENIDREVRIDSDRDDFQPASSCASEISTSSPEMSSFSSGDSRPDTEASSSVVPWAFEGCGGNQNHMPGLMLSTMDSANTAYTCSELPEPILRNMLYQDLRHVGANEYYEVTCTAERAAPIGMYYPVPQQ